MANIDVIPLTKGGYEALNKELENLKLVARPEVIKAIAEARAHGDLKENAEYHAAREKQGFIEARILDLDDKLSRAQVIEVKEDEIDRVRFGVWVTLCDDDTGEKKRYQIVGDLESDVQHNKLSISSPMVRALLGKKINDSAEIHAPRGTKGYTILKIEA